MDSDKVKKICSIGFLSLLGVAGVGTAGYFLGDAIRPRDTILQRTMEERDEYKNLYSTQATELSECKINLSKLERQVASDELTIAALQGDKAEALADKTKLQDIVNKNKQTMDENNRTIAILNDRIAKAELNGELQSNEIKSLRKQKSDLELMNSNLQASNDSLMSTIGVLNNQIVSYNNQIVALSAQVHNGATMLATLNAQIKSLNTTIAFYRQYIEDTVPEGKALATFEFDHSVYNLQVLNIGSTPSVADPTSTEYVIFGGWQANNEDVTLAEYTIEGNTTFTAKVTYRYDVKYMVDGTQYGDSQIVTSGEYAALPTTAPTKPGYKFEGYTLDGVTLVDPATTPITGHTTFIAKFTALNYEVKFMNGDEQYGNIQFILQNGSPVKPVNPIKPGYTFKGWAVGGTVVEPSTYPISANTTFEAVFEAKTLAEATWEEISAVSASGKANEVYNIGDEKTFELSTGEQVTMVILDFSKDDKTNGAGKAGITFGMKNLLATKYKYCDVTGTSILWEGCSIRNTVMQLLFTQLPDELKTLVQSVNKTTNNKVTSDKLWLFGYGEIFGNENTAYSYYNGVAKSERIKKLSNGLGSANDWWVRDYEGYNSNIMLVDSTGSYSSDNGREWEYGVCFGFCI